MGIHFEIYSKVWPEVQATLLQWKQFLFKQIAQLLHSSLFNSNLLWNPYSNKLNLFRHSCTDLHQVVMGSADDDIEYPSGNDGIIKCICSHYCYVITLLESSTDLKHKKTETFSPISNSFITCNKPKRPKQYISRVRQKWNYTVNTLHLI